MESVARDEYANDVKYMSDKLKQVHSTALAELLSYIEDTRGDFDLDQVFILTELKQFNAIILAKTANIVREDIFDKKSECFVGSFENACQDKPVPQSL
ncbi:hypothetical protein MAR_035631 [Mya arenaria]|uniref:Uncharacterized protein n=1 Tax=Mya arenaria TaxID=6604 RepID=A0ABY7EMV6_MYAAR|nr:hypothetical protein MAR_035631 [Mya arenaria]